MGRPRIGITCDFHVAIDRRGCAAPRYQLGESYVEAVFGAGGEPWLLPHLPPPYAEDIVAELDGLVISGGDFDVPPTYYGALASPKLGRVVETRSAYERALLTAALKLDKAVLGVCGGMQLINVVRGGTLYQDLSERPNTAEHQQPHDRRKPHHAVELGVKSRVARLLGRSAVGVNSTHHQVVHQVGERLMVAATAPDGVVEAVEATDAAFVVGVQWHPEALGGEHLGLYRGLVHAAEQQAQKRSK